MVACFLIIIECDSSVRKRPSEVELLMHILLYDDLVNDRYEHQDQPHWSVSTLDEFLRQL